MTFYSNGSLLKSAKPGYKEGAFLGLIFDDKQPLAKMKSGSFVTFTFDPGPHVFSTNYWWDKSPKGGAHVTLDLAANKHYYVATYFKTTLALVVQRPRIEQSLCEDAQKNATHAKPLPSSDVEKEAMPFMLAENSFPACP